MNKFKSMLIVGLTLSIFSAATPAIAGETYSPFGLRCVVNASEAEVSKVTDSLGQRFSKVWGKDWLTTPTPPKRIDPKVMEEVAAISACAAIVDSPSCSNFFSPHIGGDLTVFTDIGTNVPLRKQFDEAVAALPSSEGKTALQSCMKRVAKK
jgi:hypothetical protein